jgi:hypothetical protein
MFLGQCFGQYDESNVFVTHSGEAKIKVPVFQPSPAAKRLTYDCTWQFISSQYKEEELPEDISHLIQLMHYKQEKEMLFPIRLSLIIGRSKGWHFLTMHEFVMNEARGDKDSILLRLPYLSEWRNIVYKCSVLSDTYEHPKSVYSPLGDYHKDGTPTTDREKLLHEAEKLLDFIRNCISHRLERKIVLTPAAHQRILDAFFPMLSPKLQEAIYDVIGKERFRKAFLNKEEI